MNNFKIDLIKNFGANLKIGSTSSKIVQIIFIHQKSWDQLMANRKNLNMIFFVYAQNAINVV